MQRPQIHTFSQLQEQLLEARAQLEKILDSICPSQLGALDMESQVQLMTTPTIDQIIESLPSQAHLSEILKLTKSIQYKREIIMNYTGNSKLIQEFKMGIEKTKQISVDTYYLFTLLNPPILRDMEEHQTRDNNLESWSIKINDPAARRVESNMLRYDYREYLKGIQTSKIKQKEMNPKLLLSEEDLMIHLVFYDSHLKEKQNQFICHSSTLLTELGDKFYCLITDLEENSGHTGSFFFINQTFYNDTRYGRENISEGIIQSARRNDVVYDYYSMESTRLKSIRAEIGKPYIWRHLKGCDHMIVFSEYRLLNPRLDLRMKSEYPLNIFQKKINRKRCQGCKTHFAKIVSQNDKNKNGQNLYLCLSCHEHIHIQRMNEGDITLPKYPQMNISKYLHE